MSNPRPNDLKVLGLCEVVLNVNDISAMRAFYGDVLGFKFHSEYSMEGSVHDPDGEPTICFLSITDTDTPLGVNGHPQLLALIDHRRHIYAKQRFQCLEHESSSLNHVAFEVAPDQLGRFAEYLESHEIELQQAQFPAMQARALFLRDPEGNSVELICHDPNVTQQVT